MLEKDELFALMNEHGIVRAQLEFSGGNDEGGLDHFSFTHSDGRVVSGHNHSDLESEVYDWRTGKMQPNPIALQYGPLARVYEQIVNTLWAPVEREYHSFAGDFRVTGTVEAVPATGRFVFSHEYQEYRGEYEEVEL